MEGYLRTTLGVGLATTFSGHQAGKIDRREEQFLATDSARQRIQGSGERE